MTLRSQPSEGCASASFATSARLNGGNITTERRAGNGNQRVGPKEKPDALRLGRTLAFPAAEMALNASPQNPSLSVLRALCRALSRQSSGTCFPTASNFKSSIHACPWPANKSPNAISWA